MENNYKIWIFTLVILGITFIVTNSCQKDDPKILKDLISGQVQKGPFINGTSILMSELTSTLQQTGNSFTTQILNNAGSFEINNISLTSSFVEFQATGFYFDEVKGDKSIAPLTLYALSDISDISDISTVNVNIITHLEKQRVDYLVKQEKTFSDAKKKAQTEIMTIFGISQDEMNVSETLDISVNNESNAILLAISIILQGNRSVGDLTELLANISNDIREDGILNSTSILLSLRNSTKDLSLISIRTNLESRYKDLGISASIPGFEKYINVFLAFTGEMPSVTSRAATNISTASATLNGEVNANSLITSVTFEFGTTSSFGDSIVALQSPLNGSTPVIVSTEINGLLPGTTYHFRVNSTNSLGTIHSGEMIFTTLGAAPSVTANAATNLTTTSAKLNGEVNANSLITSVTFEFGTTPSFGDSVFAVQSPLNGSTPVIVSTEINGLLPGTTYHFRVNSTNSLGTIHSSEMIFTTLGAAPSVTANAATNLTTTSVKLNGNVNANYLSTNITFEYGLTSEYEDSIIAPQSPISGSSLKSVTAELPGLSIGTIYHYRIKAENSLGTNYSNDMTFTTLGNAPIVIAEPATNVASVSSSLNGAVNANFLTTSVTFEYGLSTQYENSIIAIQSPIIGNSPVNVSVDITGLLQGTTYHYRLKAENDLGVTFSNDLTFSTHFTGLTGTVIDIDGNTYKTIGIDTQIWMAENLKTTKYNDGKSIPPLTQVQFTPGYYPNDSDNYGAWYNWHTVSTGKLCPSGWHVPTDGEWTVLTNFLGGEAVAGGKLKEVGFAHWNDPNTSATNEVGFTALPAGYTRGGGQDSWKGINGFWWSSTEYDAYGAWSRNINYRENDVYRSAVETQPGYSVRCIKD